MPMQGSEFRRLRHRLGLTQRAWAARLGLHWNSVARMERGEVTISEPVARLARLLAERAAPAGQAPRRAGRR